MVKKKSNPNMICSNKKAKFDYFIKDHLEAGIVLEGWEVKSLRAKKAQLVDSYILIKRSEAYVIGAVIQPLANTDFYSKADPQRTRKLLLHSKEIDRLRAHAEQKGQTLIASGLYWKKNKVKLDIAIALGKKQHDKREATKQREWDRERSRITKLAQR